MDTVNSTRLKLLYDKISPNECAEGIIFAYDCPSEIYKYKSLERVKEDLEGKNKYKLSEAVSYFFGKIVTKSEENKDDDYIRARIFTSALAVAYKVNPEELYNYFKNYEFCQTY